MPLHPLSKRARVGSVPQVGLKNPHRRAVTVLLQAPQLDGLYEVQTHHGCIHNETRALHNRHLKAVPNTLTRRGLRAVRRQLVRISQRVGPVHPIGLDAVLAHVPSRKKRLYRSAAMSLLVREVDGRDAEVKMFVKQDRYDAQEIVDKEPRAIQYRSPRYNLCLQQFLHPFERAYYNTTTAERGGPVKGKNSWERASLYNDALINFVDPIVLSLDFKKFDAHLQPEMLHEEHKAYLRSMPYDELRLLLNMQHKNKCRTQGGLRYYVDGTRMSGDVNTGLGNTMLAQAFVEAWAVHHGIKIVCFVDGDDVIIIMERGRVPSFEFFLELGMEATVEVLEVPHLTHCQSKIIRVGKRARMVRNPLRAISHGCCTVRNYPPSLMPGLLAAMGMSELACSNGLPILQEWALAQIRVANSPAWTKFDEDIAWRAKREGRAVSLAISSEAREDFEEKFGISISTQLAYEKALRTLTPADFLPARRVDVWHKTKQASTWGQE